MKTSKGLVKLSFTNVHSQTDRKKNLSSAEIFRYILNVKHESHGNTTAVSGCEYCGEAQTAAESDDEPRPCKNHSLSAEEDGAPQSSWLLPSTRQPWAAGAGAAAMSLLHDHPTQLSLCSAH